jgi:hypothetical protein
MDEQTLANAAVYSRIKAMSLAYYHAHATEISERRKAKYRAAHPNPRPRGRPPKVVEGVRSGSDEGGGVPETDSGNTSSSSSERV